jgi:hypothetical protein
VPIKKEKQPLSVTHPELAKEADGWDPKDFTKGSASKLSWKCPLGHSYKATPNSRTSNKTGCSVCSNKTILIGFNDLATTHPELAKEADGWDPKTVVAGTEKKLNWICPIGHKYQAMPGARSSRRKTGCPICSNNIVLPGFNDLLSKFPEIAQEADGWDTQTVIAGSNKKLSWRCKSGHQYETTVGARTGTKKSGCPICANLQLLKGFNDLATTHPEIAKEADGWDPTTVVAGTTKRRKWKCIQGHNWEVSVGSRTGSRVRGCPVCTNKTVLKGFNDLATLFPEIAKEAEGWDPTTVIAGSNKSKKWRCSNNHLYIAMVNSRTSASSGCGFCSGRKVLSGFNDLETRFPEIAKEALDWDPKGVMPGSEVKRNWKCKKGHNFNASPVARTSGGTGCPICSNFQILIGYNDLATTHPDLAIEADGWDPTEFIAGSEKKVKWKCTKGHSYEAMPATRTRSNPTNCPVCANQKLLVGFNDLATTYPGLAKEALGWDPTTVIAGTNKKLWWKCPDGHKYQTSPNRRIGEKGTGCPTCANSGFDPNDDGYLYFIEHLSWEMFQIGITNNPDKRLGQHRKLGWDLLELRGPMDGHLTQQWETAILRMLKAKGADLSNSKIAGKFDGYSEAWSKSTFDAKSIKELMRLTEEFES